MSASKKTATKASSKKPATKKPRGRSAAEADAAHKIHVEAILDGRAGSKPTPEQAPLVASWVEKPLTAEDLQRSLREELRVFVAADDSSGRGFVRVYDDVNSEMPRESHDGVFAASGTSKEAIGSDGRVVFLGDAVLNEHEARTAAPPAIRPWFDALLSHGFLAVLEAAADVAGFAEPEEFNTNVLSALGNLVSKAVRRRVLLGELEAADWNLSVASERLRMGGAGNVTKAIKDLGLDRELAAARAAGKAKPGGRR